MEIEGEDDTELYVKTGSKAVFGRGDGFNTDDLTVSRRHVSFEVKPSAAGTERPDRVSFEVLGRNPVWVRAGESGKKIRTFRKSETGEIVAGDQFCVSGNQPIWFTLKSRDEEMENTGLDGDNEFEDSVIDPVKEFGFLVIGKEFDQYPKSRMRDVKQWEWFLEDSTNRNSDDEDEDEGEKRRKRLSKKRRKKRNEEDDDWSSESEEDKELIVKSKRVVKPTYLTRSKKTKKDTNTSTSSSRAQTKQRGRVDVEEEEEESDDETLGGFIVSDEEAKLEEEDKSDVDDEEEDLDEDEDEDEE